MYFNLPNPMHFFLTDVVMTLLRLFKLRVYVLHFTQNSDSPIKQSLTPPSEGTKAYLYFCNKSKF